MALDTGDLTDKTYKAIRMEAGGFHHDLTLQFGLPSDECDDEATFLKMSEELICEMLTYDEDGLRDIFFEGQPHKKDFHVALNKILGNISKLPK